jgi:hypothetical protein
VKYVVSKLMVSDVEAGPQTVVAENPLIDKVDEPE